MQSKTGHIVFLFGIKNKNSEFSQIILDIAVHGRFIILSVYNMKQGLAKLQTLYL